MTLLGYLVAFFQQYLVPFIFAIAVIFLIYGIIQYFIVGPGEEPTREDGRQSFIKAFFWLLVGVAVYLVVAFLVWSFTFLAQFSVDGGSEERLQNVPNTPTRNN